MKTLPDPYSTEATVSFRVSYIVAGALAICGLAATGCPKRFSPPSGTSSVDCTGRIEANRNRPAALRDAVDRDGAAFASLSEEMLATRAETMALVARMMDTEDSGPLRSADLDELKRRLRNALERNQALESLAAANDCWIDDEASGLDPSLRRDGNTVGLATSLLVYDGYAATVSVLNEDPRLRRFLNESDIGYGVAADQLDALTEAHVSIASRLRVRAQIAFSEAHPGPASTPDIEYAALFVERSPSYAALRDLGPGDMLAGPAERAGRRSQDELAAVASLGVGGISRVFGNSVGMVQVRDGKLFGDDDARAHLRHVLRPGDILIEKTPFRLTDKIIPGYWGHAAIWLGTEPEIRALGIWEHPVVQRHQPAIREEQLVVEALRDGVQTSPLAHFLNVDDVAVLRRRGITDAQRAERVVLALRQVGKDYDFNFDVERTDQIVCSELVYIVYNDVDWQTDEKLGRYTISPDQIAVRASDDDVLEVVALYHDGERVDGDLTKTFNELLEQP